MIEVQIAGRTFRADGDKLTWSPFGDYDWLFLMSAFNKEPIVSLEPDRDSLIIRTASRDYRLTGVESDFSNWKVTLTRQ